MKIAFLAPANSIHSYKWIKYFAGKGHEILWVTLHPVTVGLLDNVTVREVQLSRANPLGSVGRILKIRRLIKGFGPDVLHVHSAGIYGLVGAIVRQHPFIVTAWGTDVLGAVDSLARRFFVKYVLTKCQLITCDADHMIAAMKGLGVDETKMRLIYFGIDTDRFQPAAKNRQLIEQLGLFNAPTVISLRSFYPIYDIESLIKAVPIVTRVIPDVKFVLVGSGPEEEKLRSLASSLQVQDAITFIGRIPNEALPEYLNSMDTYVSTSLSDAGIAASTAEAMACGLPVVITDSGENRKWVQDGEGGCIVPVKDPAALAEKILYLIKSPDVRVRYGAINRRTIMEKNDYYREMVKMENIYASLLTGSKSHR
jgi:L-malate glycosyltransferase